ncbi:Ectonucleotide pyrophosphatase/phosphodiesterase family member 7 [Pteropus alecto]|uniref:Ectonucleotide pyrophosphatase/phosphodiesterase family member 7 n=1 Tax=Pteropus alecto TaxID=9402 RepID=L5KLV5_PTEAL|nr:Ectonucleotide pyrophosphatase/phosphodiesterase family member 7 [Pteropus alecto]
MLLPKEGMLEKVHGVLKDAHPRLHVYKKGSFPQSLRYAGNHGVTALLTYGDPGYVIHGRLNVQFDNEVLDMKTTFQAVGPNFRRGLEVEPFENVHMYELMCKLLGLMPEASDSHLGAPLPTPSQVGSAPSGGPALIVMPGGCGWVCPASPARGCLLGAVHVLDTPRTPDSVQCACRQCRRVDRWTRTHSRRGG